MIATIAIHVQHRTILAGMLENGADIVARNERDDVAVAMSLFPDFRIEDRIEDVDGQIDRNHEGGEQHDCCLYDREVAGARGSHEATSNTRPGEDRLDERGAAE